MDLGTCWQSGVWANGSWVDGVWCPVTPPTPTPTPIVTVVTDDRRWPGPPIVLYRETDVIPAWQRKREDEEIMII